MATFALDIRPLFRARDVEHMRFAFDLSQYEDVRARASEIMERLQDGTMPCDDIWPEEQISLFRQWMDEGYLA